MATSAGVSVYANEPAGKRNVAGSIYNEFIDTLIKNEAAYGIDSLLSWVVVNTEDIKLIAETLLEKANVEVLYHMTLADAKCSDKHIESVTFLGKSGQYHVSAKVFIDCTGDAQLAYLAGLPTSSSDCDNLQPMTMIYYVGNVDVAKAIDSGATSIKNKYLWWGEGNEVLMGYIEKAKSNGQWPIPKRCFSIMWSNPRCPAIVGVNGTRITGFNGANSIDLSKAEKAGRMQAFKAVEFMRNYLPGFQNAYLVNTGPQIGIRETRRIIGTYQLSEIDIMCCRMFDNQIAEAAYCIDLHQNDSSTLLKKLPQGGSYGIPYSCLLSSSCDNYLVAGRAISATRQAASSARVMPICMSTGQAAGAAAGLAVANKNNVHEVNTKNLQDILQRTRKE